MRRAISLLILSGLAVCSGCRRSLPAKGDELFSVLDEAVLEVSLHSATKRAEAHRFSADQPFHFSFESAPGTHFERCRATPALSQALAKTLQIRVRALVAPERAKALLAARDGSWIEFQIRDVMDDSAPFRLLLRAQGAPSGRAYAHLPDETSVFLVDRSLLELLDRRCSD